MDEKTESEKHKNTFVKVMFDGVKYHSIPVSSVSASRRIQQVLWKKDGRLLKSIQLDTNFPSSLIDEYVNAVFLCKRSLDNEFLDANEDDLFNFMAISVYMGTDAFTKFIFNGIKRTRVLARSSLNQAAKKMIQTKLKQ